MLLMGNDDSPMNYTDNIYPFRQDSHFLYFFGLDRTGLAGVIDLDEQKTIVFGDELTLDHIIWMGPQPTVKELAKKAGVVHTGTSAQLVAKEGDYAQVRLPSGEVRKVHILCRATVGQVGNADYENVSLGKAGATRWRGRRPKVRGVAMNPVDHPMGGGEGKSSGGRHPCSPWGWKTKGFRTRNNKRTEQFIVRRRSKRR